MSSVEDLRADATFMDKYSRQIAAYGLEAMLKLVKMRILIVGLRGIGIEVAKNSCLAGVSMMTLHDPEPVSIEDLGSNFFLTEEELNEPRAKVCTPKVQELNDTCAVECSVGELNEELVSNHGIMVMTQGTREEAIRWNNFCRTQSPPISFVQVITSGVFGSVFVDHGDEFEIKDPDGKAPLVKLCSPQAKPYRPAIVEMEDDDGKYTLCTCITPDGQTPGSFPDNGLVVFSDVDGCKTADGKSINDMGPLRIYRKEGAGGDPCNTFRIGANSGEYTPLSGLSAWEASGFVTQEKEPKKVSFRSLEANIDKPGGLGAMFGMKEGFVWNDKYFGMDELHIHVAYQAVYDFVAEKQSWPKVNDSADAEACVAYATKYMEKVEGFGMGLEVKEPLVTKIANFAGVELQAMTAFWGGIVSQELVKVSGKFTPIQQYLNVSMEAVLPDTKPTDTDPIGSRYDDLIQIFGRSFVERLGNLNIFMVGCGALGCEYIKNFALNGVCCGPEGNLTITDNDRIEVSNLNRQFLFRADNVGQAKSSAAFERAQLMNKNIKVTALQEFVGPSTENIFDNDFWCGVDLVANALDNMKARFYVDDKCVFYEKPLLESGTMGTGFNVDVVVPHMTKSYKDGGEADEGGGVPMCTLRNFPHLIDHCIEWSRAQLEDMFAVPAAQAATFLENAEEYVAKKKATTIDDTSRQRHTKIQQALDMLTKVKATLEIAAGKPTIEVCVEMAWNSFHQMFRDKINDLTSMFPKDAKDKAGNDFWSGHRKYPSSAEYDSENPLHVAYMINATNLYASMLALESHPVKPPPEVVLEQRWCAQFREPKWLNGIVSKLAVPEYKKGKVGDLTGDEDGAAAEADTGNPTEELNAIFDELLELAKQLDGATLIPADFEKDDDDNFHIDFITACSNLRAFNYQIPAAPRDKCKVIAGKIIPAIATTTASVCGLVMLEMFKMLQHKPVEAMQNGNCDIGSNVYNFFEAMPPARIQMRTELNKEMVKVALINYPDQFDDKGNLKDEFKEYYEETVGAFPDPHNKWDKNWLDGTKDLTLQGLIDAINGYLNTNGAPEGTRVSLVSGPVTTEKDESGDIKASSTMYWNPQMKSTQANLDVSWTKLLMEKDGLDVSNLDFLALTDTIMTVAISDKKDCMVEVPMFLLRLSENSAFKTYSAQRFGSGMWRTMPWVESETLRRQLGALESYTYSLEERLTKLEAK
jgi:ubiquitin-activating enzyme E1